MSIKPVDYDPLLNVLNHINVSVSKRYEDMPEDKRETQREMGKIISYFINNRPTWRFIAFDGHGYDGKRVFNGFEIYEDNELLGTVNTTYQRTTSSYKIIVENERISNDRQRGKGYKTENYEKAITKIRKTFYRLGVFERVVKVKEQAQKVVGHEHSSKQWDVHRAENELFSDAQAFAHANLDLYLAEHPHHEEHKDKFVHAHDAFMVVDHVKTVLDKGNALIVVLDGERYIVVQGDNGTAVYDNDSLPYNIKVKLGLLKLVNDHQMISDVGCRVSAEAFVLVPTDEEKA